MQFVCTHVLQLVSTPPEHVQIDTAGRLITLQACLSTTDVYTVIIDLLSYVIRGEIRLLSRVTTDLHETITICGLLICQITQ